MSLTKPIVLRTTYGIAAEPQACLYSIPYYILFIYNFTSSLYNRTTEL